MLKHKLTIVLSTSMLALMGFAVFMLYDEPLSDDARYLLSLVEEPRENDAYYLLMGLGVAEELDPIETGKACVHQGSNLCNSVAWDFEKAPVCQDEFIECALLSDITAELEYYSPLISRMEAFLSSEEYHVLTPPVLTPESIDVRWGLAFRIMSLRIAQHLQAGEADELVSLLTKLRRHAVMADSLMGRYVLLNGIAMTLDSLVELDARSDVMPLTDKERSFARVYAHAYMSVYDSLEQISEEVKAKSSLSYLLGHPLYKERLTKNLLAKQYLLAVDNAWSLEEANITNFRMSLAEYPTYEYLRNSIGVMYARVAAPMVLSLTDLERRISKSIEVLNNPG